MIFKRKHANPILLFCLLFFSSCSIFNQEEPLPSYINIEAIPLKTAINQGSASHKITDVWVFNDTEFLGMFPLPAKIPLLLYGEQNLTLQAGIKENGIGSTPENYPFYSSVKVKLNLNALQTILLKPETTYLPTTKFHIIENFENNSSFFSFLVNGLAENSILPFSGNEVFEGKYAGKIQLTKQAPTVTIGANAKFKHTFTPGQPVFLELDYKAEIPCIVGIQFYDTENTDETGLIVPIAGFKESASWNKIYFNLGNILAARKSVYYRVIFKATLPEGKENARILLDNIKLISF
jgi:hypothetical protein